MGIVSIFLEILCARYPKSSKLRSTWSSKPAISKLSGLQNMHNPGECSPSNDTDSNICWVWERPKGIGLHAMNISQFKLRYYANWSTSKGYVLCRQHWFDMYWVKKGSRLRDACLNVEWHRDVSSRERMIVRDTGHKCGRDLIRVELRRAQSLGMQAVDADVTRAALSWEWAQL